MKLLKNEWQPLELATLKQNVTSTCLINSDKTDSQINQNSNTKMV